MPNEENRLEINWVNALGGALGAVSAAVLLSTLGAAGTLLGAALGSLCITVGGAFYAHSLKVARDRVAAAQVLAARRRPRTRTTGSVDVADRGTEAVAVPDEAAAGALPAKSRLQVLRELPWKRILVVSAALFVVAMAAILTFELATGRPVSSVTGGTSDTDRGTSVPGLGGREDGSAPQEEQAPQQQDEVEEDDQPEPAPEEPTPTEAETVEPAPTEAPVPTQETAP